MTLPHPLPPIIAFCLSVLTAIITATITTTTASAQPFETQAKFALIIDQTHNTVLFEKDADTGFPPASMSKLMTLNMLFEALRDGRVTLDTEFTVSERAHAIGGSTMFLRHTERVAIKNLIPGIIVQSGNDACITVAEGLAGSEDAFARQMTARAAELGMTQSVFTNSTGWPAPNHRMSARDLAFIAQRLMTEFPEFYPYFAQTEFTWDNITQANRNPLLSLGIGADGLKTGYTEESGYSLTGAAKAGNRRIVFVVSGLESKAERARESERVASWAVQNFREKQILAGGEVLGTADVWLGAVDSVGLYTRDAISVLLPVAGGKSLQAEVQFTNPIPAPIEKDAAVGTLIVSAYGGERSYPLYAQTAVEQSGTIRATWQKLRILGARMLGQDLYSVGE